MDEFNLPTATSGKEKRRTKKKVKEGTRSGHTSASNSLNTFTQVAHGEYDMSWLLTHVVKPINLLLDPEKRENQVELDRGQKHLDKLTPEYVTQSLNHEPAIAKVNNMEASIQELQRSVLGLMRARAPTQDAFSRTLTDKAWQRAVANMNGNVKVICRTLSYCSFKQ